MQVRATPVTVMTDVEGSVSNSTQWMVEGIDSEGATGDSNRLNLKAKEAAPTNA